MLAEAAIARVLELLPQDATNFAREFVAEWLMQVEFLRRSAWRPVTGSRCRFSAGEKVLLLI